MQLRGDLYVGGMPSNRYDGLPEQIMSKHGYRGCMASVRIQRKLVNLLADALTKTEYLRQGCTRKGFELFSEQYFPPAIVPHEKLSRKDQNSTCLPVFDS